MGSTFRRPSRLSTIAGVLGALLMLLSAPVHSLSGWPELQSALTSSNASADLVLALRIGWHFAGAAMAGFGLILLHLFLSRARGTDGTVVPAWMIGGLYVLFGVTALVVSGFDPFFLVFIVPGGLVLVGVLV
ncbi:MAG: hypothetical protein AB7N65_20815 [Vicinamibacterales bacterium]